jgi:hypothetical protein
MLSVFGKPTVLIAMAVLNVKGFLNTLPMRFMKLAIFVNEPHQNMCHISRKLNSVCISDTISSTFRA